MVLGEDLGSTAGTTITATGFALTADGRLEAVTDANNRASSNAVGSQILVSLSTWLCLLFSCVSQNSLCNHVVRD